MAEITINEVRTLPQRDRVMLLKLLWLLLLYVSKWVVTKCYFKVINVTKGDYVKWLN